MKIPHPGDLRHRVEIGQTINTVNENGFPVESESVICTVWAGLEDNTSSSGFLYASDAENARKARVFIIRWREGIAEGMWVRHDGEKFPITQVGEYDFKRRYLRLTTQSTKGVQ